MFVLFLFLRFCFNLFCLFVFSFAIDSYSFFFNIFKPFFSDFLIIPNSMRKKSSVSPLPPYHPTIDLTNIFFLFLSFHSVCVFFVSIFFFFLLPLVRFIFFLQQLYTLFIPYSQRKEFFKAQLNTRRHFHTFKHARKSIFF